MLQIAIGTAGEKLQDDSDRDLVPQCARARVPSSTPGRVLAICAEDGWTRRAAAVLTVTEVEAVLLHSASGRSTAS